MRVATSMIFDAGVSTMNKQTASLMHTQQQIASGKRILRPSDDPVAAARVLEVTQSKDILTQFGTNQGNASSTLGLTEAQLTSLNELLVRARELVIQAGGSAVTASNRQSIAVELRARYQDLMNTANAADGQGQFMFSGYKGDTRPFGGTVDFLLAGNEISYAGDGGQRVLQVSASRMMEVSEAGSEVFMRIENGNGYFATGYATGNTGTGTVDIGAINDPVAWNALTNKNLSINFTSATNYDIVDGLSNTLVSGGTYQSGQPITIPGAGASVVIRGAPAAGDSFSLDPSSSQSVFKTLANLIGALEAGGTTAADEAKYASELGFALANIDHASDSILRTRAAIGSRMNELDALGVVSDDLNLQYDQTLSGLQDLDYAKAISELTLKKTELEAAQESFSRISQLSLFSYL